MATMLTSSVLDCLRSALSDRSKALIFTELLSAGELTGTMLAERAGLSPNTMYYHLQQLEEGGTVVRTREEVMRGFCRDKYYAVAPAIRDLLESGPGAIDRVLAQASPEERRAIYVSYMVVAAGFLARAADRYLAMDLDEFDNLFQRDRQAIISIGALSDAQYAEVLAIARQYLAGANWDIPRPEEKQRPSDFGIMALLPRFLPDEPDRELEA